MKTLNLLWKGPFDFFRIQEIEKLKQWKGVYLWTLMGSDGSFDIIYVGGTPKGGTLYYRLIDELNDIRRGRSWLIDISKYRTSRDLDVIYIPGLNENKSEENSQNNIDNIKIFYSRIEEGNDILTQNEVIKRVEGYIQKVLWKSMSTRKYLLTSVATWDKLEMEIVHKVESSENKINGIN